jgi:abhydrolase domain-containing protein 17
VTSSVVAKMAFFPPTPPSYVLAEDAAAGITTLSGQSHQENVEVVRLVYQLFIHLSFNLRVSVLG